MIITNFGILELVITITEGLALMSFTLSPDFETFFSVDTAYNKTLVGLKYFSKLGCSP